ncbi:MAG: hypothetical protein U0V75_06325 [Ferruginibacter sp.]
MIQQAIPVLQTINIIETIMFYKNVLGFTGTDMGAYAVLKKGSTELHFELCTHEKPCTASSCYIRVSDIQCLFSSLAAKGFIYPENQLKDLPGHKKGFTLKDNNGILLRFVQEK